MKEQPDVGPGHHVVADNRIEAPLGPVGGQLDGLGRPHEALHLLGVEGVTASADVTEEVQVSIRLSRDIFIVYGLLL